MSDQDGIVACMRLNKKLTDRLNWFKDQVSPSMWPDHGLANLQKLARSIRVNGSEHTVDRILDAFVNNELPWVAPESLYDIPPGCICQGDGLMGMECTAAEHAQLKDPRDERIRELVVALNQAQTNFLKEYWARRTAEGKAVEAEMARAARDSVIAELNGIIDRSLGKEISALRVAQDLAYGGPKHDDTHTPVEWRVFIQIYNNLGEEYASEPEIRESKLLAVAGLAVAAIQSSRRKRNA